MVVYWIKKSLSADAEIGEVEAGVGVIGSNLVVYVDMQIDVSILPTRVGIRKRNWVEGGIL